jgi:DNA-binding MarR family transcriptional regulator/N-acetylglutamate synthase-like GNAT family acetyltransferase
MARIDREPIAQKSIGDVRRFNRFYTRHLGVLQNDWLDSPFSLTEARVLYELTRQPRMTATAIGVALELDAGYLSRLLRDFENKALIERRPSPEDARQSLVALTAKGRRAFAPLERKSQEQVGADLGKLAASDRPRLIAAMGTITNLLEAGAERRYTLRAPRRGDFGWIVSRHAELYAQEYGWTEPFAGLCAQIVADYANGNDPKKERCWIAELNGSNVGCVMLVKDKKPGIARIRLLLVDPAARGLGLGARLVDECVRFSRKAGYRGVTLWTHSVLSAARHVYEKAGFTLTASEKRKSWSQDVVAEFWDLKF